MTKYNGSDLTSLNDNLLEKNYAPAYGMAWWQLLQKYMRIDGDIKTQSVTMTIVYRDVTDNGHIRYKTYYIPRPVYNNVIAYLLQILDDKNEITGNSKRTLDNTTHEYELKMQRQDIRKTHRISQQSRGSFFYTLI